MLTAQAADSCCRVWFCMRPLSWKPPENPDERTKKVILEFPFPHPAKLGDLQPSNHEVLALLCQHKDVDVTNHS